MAVVIILSACIIGISIVSCIIAWKRSSNIWYFLIHWNFAIGVVSILVTTLRSGFAPRRLKTPTERGVHVEQAFEKDTVIDDD